MAAPLAVLVCHPQLELRQCEAPVGGLAEPFHGSCVVPRHSVARGVKNPELELRRRMALRSGLAKSANCFGLVDREALAELIHQFGSVPRVRVSALCQRLQFAHAARVLRRLHGVGGPPGSKRAKVSTYIAIVDLQAVRGRLPGRRLAQEVPRAPRRRLSGGTGAGPGRLPRRTDRLRPEPRRPGAAPARPLRDLPLGALRGPGRSRARWCRSRGRDETRARRTSQANPGSGQRQSSPDYVGFFCSHSSRVIHASRMLTCLASSPTNSFAIATIAGSFGMPATML